MSVLLSLTSTVCSHTFCYCFWFTRNVEWWITARKLYLIIMKTWKKMYTYRGCEVEGISRCLMKVWFFCCCLRARYTLIRCAIVFASFTLVCGELLLKNYNYNSKYQNQQTFIIFFNLFFLPIMKTYTFNVVKLVVMLIINWIENKIVLKQWFSSTKQNAFKSMRKKKNVNVSPNE